jgi:hypothetical protein
MSGLEEASHAADSEESCASHPIMSMTLDEADLIVQGGTHVDPGSKSPSPPTLPASPLSSIHTPSHTDSLWNRSSGPLRTLRTPSNDYPAELVRSWRSHQRNTRLLLTEQDVKDMAHDHAFVVMVFTDIVGYTHMCSRVGDARKVMLYLNDLFSLFDVGVQLNECYKLETIGDAYIAAAGLLHTARPYLSFVPRVF